jgi:hypothetical protein
MKPLVLVLACLATASTLGCSTSATMAKAAPRYPVRWETTELADGVEIRVRQDASPGARSAAEQVVVQYESGYLNAR